MLPPVFLKSWCFRLQAHLKDFFSRNCCHHPSLSLLPCCWKGGSGGGNVFLRSDLRRIFQFALFQLSYIKSANSMPIVIRTPPLSKNRIASIIFALLPGVLGHDRHSHRFFPPTVAAYRPSGRPLKVSWPSPGAIASVSERYVMASQVKLQRCGSSAFGGVGFSTRERYPGNQGVFRFSWCLLDLYLFWGEGWRWFFLDEVKMWWGEVSFCDCRCRFFCFCFSSSLASHPNGIKLTVMIWPTEKCFESNSFHVYFGQWDQICSLIP